MIPDRTSDTPFMKTDTLEIIEKLKESTGNDYLDNLREQTFLSLSSKATPDMNSGINRAIQLLYSCGQGFFITHAFSFNPEDLLKQPPSSDAISGKTLNQILENKVAYESIYDAYLKEYRSQPLFSSEYIELANLTKCNPQKALPILRLLQLIIVTTRY